MGAQRTRTKKLIDGEQARDESFVKEEKLKIVVWNSTLDDVISHLNVRLNDGQLRLLSVSKDCHQNIYDGILATITRPMMLLTCNIYGLNASVVAKRWIHSIQFIQGCEDDIDDTFTTQLCQSIANMSLRKCLQEVDENGIRATAVDLLDVGDKYDELASDVIDSMNQGIDEN